MHNFEDEVARRRAARRAKQQQGREEPPDDRDDDDEIPQFSWSDTFAMIIAAYQVLMPMVLAMAGVLVLAYFLFKWIFS
ncbi:MAG: hypothetical protein ACOY94_09300 [Bacillota bacterium]